MDAQLFQGLFDNGVAVGMLVWFALKNSKDQELTRMALEELRTVVSELKEVVKNG